MSFFDQVCPFRFESRLDSIIADLHLPILFTCFSMLFKGFYIKIDQQSNKKWAPGKKVVSG